MGGIVSPIISHVEVLIPSTSECDLDWKQGCFRCNQLTWGLWVSPNPIGQCPYKKGIFGHRNRDTGRMPRKEWSCHKPRDIKECWPTTCSWERGREQVLPHSPQREPTLPTLWSRTFPELRDNKCLLFEATWFWYFVTAALGNEDRYHIGTAY